MNRGPFRRLWLGDAVSLFGDWFSYVAVGVLALGSDDSGNGLLAVAVVLLAHSLPLAVVAPLAGRFADRYDRRSIMVGASLLRGVAVVGMIIAAMAGSLAWVSGLLFVRMGFGAFIDPAASASLQQLVPRSDLSRANALLSATWSCVFAIGVAVGGLFTAAFGPVWALAVDGLTFVLAAIVLATLPRLRPGESVIPGRSQEPGVPLDASAKQPAAPQTDVEEPPGVDMGELGPGLLSALRFAWHNRPIFQAAVAKMPVAFANGGGWVLLHHAAAVGGAEVGGTAVALGVLHSARALGTGIGPVLWARSPTLGGTTTGLHVSIGFSLASVVAFILAPTPWVAVVACVVWGFGSGANWVTAVTRVQMLTPNRALGRVASIDLIVHTMSQALGGLCGALVADAMGLASLSGWVGLAAGIVAWGLLVSLTGKRGAAVGLTGVLVLASLGTGCRPQPESTPAPVAVPNHPPPSTVDAPPPSRARAPIEVTLEGHAVYADDYARQVLYTWTTHEQEQELRASLVLLVADASTGRMSMFNRELLRLAATSDPGSAMAQQLSQRETLRRRRYAWPNPFATTLGLGPRRYGDVLVAVRLADDAWIARFEPHHRSQPFAVVDLQGARIPLEQALATPDRIAAVFHLADGPDARIAFREFVICNESMVAQWSVATPEIEARIAAELELMVQLQTDVFRFLPARAVEESAAVNWRRSAQPNLVQLWHASLAFDNQRYRPSTANLGRLVEVLGQYEAFGEPLVVVPELAKSRPVARGQASGDLGGSSSSVPGE